MREAAARCLAGFTSLGESESHDSMPVDRLHALAHAQRRETYGDGTKAAQAAYLASLGVDLMRLKLSNIPAAFAPCLEKLTVALMWRSDALRIKEAQASVIASQVIQEHVIDFCPTCTGRGEVPIQGIDRDGIVPMQECGTCGGHGTRRYTDHERAEAIGEARKLQRAFDSAHSIISTAIAEALWNARRFMR